jgi:hypothetical protein
MKILLEKSEAEEMFYDALCNGLNELSYYGLKFSFFDQDYETACDKLKAETNRTSTICYEDVLMQILRDGKKLSVSRLHITVSLLQGSRVRIAWTGARVSKKTFEKVSPGLYSYPIFGYIYYIT